MQSISEFEVIKERVASLERRMAKVEAAGDTEARSAPVVEQPVTRAFTEEPPQPSASPSVQKSFLEKERERKTQAQSGGESESPRSDDTESHTAPGSLETEIGQYWLSRIGIAILVIGVASFIGYAFQNFGPHFKILFGYACSATLLWLGGKFEARRDSLPSRMSWYGRTLAGGGWALAYFTTYAMHHISSVRLINDGVLDLALLLCVAGAALWNSLYRNSELMALFSVLLGFVTIGLSTMTAFSLIATSILLLTLSILVARKQWYNLLIAGVLCCYGSYWSSDVSAAIAHSDQVQARIGAVLNLMYLFAFNALLFRLDEKGKHRDYLVWTCLLNGLGFFINAMWLGSVLNISNATILAAVGTFYVGSGFLARRMQLPGIANLQMFAGLAAASAAIPAELDDRWTLLGWTSEVALLTWIGLEYKIQAIRWFALCLAFCVGITTFGVAADQTFLGSTGIHWRLTIMPITALSFLATALLYRAGRYREQLGESQVFCHAFELFAAGLLWSLIAYEFDYNHTLQLCLSSAEAATLYFLGVKYKDVPLRYVSIMGLWLSTLCFCFLADYIMPLVAWSYVGMLFAAAALVKLSLPSLPESESRCSYYLLTVPAVLAMWSATSSLHNGFGYCAILSVQAILLLLFGFFVKDNPTRIGAFIHYLIASLIVIFASGQQDTLPAAIVIFWTGVAALCYRTTALHTGMPAAEMRLGSWYWGLACTSLTALTMAKLEGSMISTAWTLEAAVFLTAGFLMREKVLRIFGLLLFGVLIFKLLVVDLSQAETLVRVGSFMFAGITLLAGSYGYSWFSRKLDDQNKFASTSS